MSAALEVVETHFSPASADRPYNGTAHWEKQINTGEGAHAAGH